MERYESWFERARSSLEMARTKFPKNIKNTIKLTKYAIETRYPSGQLFGMGWE